MAARQDAHCKIPHLSKPNTFDHVEIVRYIPDEIKISPDFAELLKIITRSDA